MDHAIPINDVNFQKIICFYLFECPARSIHIENKKKDEPETTEQPHPKKRFYYSRISKMGKTLEERGITGGRVNSLLAAMVRAAGNDFEFSAGPEIVVSTKKEYISIVRTDFKTEGIFAFIRNALAHGEFTITDGIYYLENHSKEVLKGKATISETTLLKWIEIVDMPAESFKLIGR